MNTLGKSVCALTVGAALIASAPASADSYRNRGYEHDHRAVQYRDYGHRDFRAHDRRPVIVMAPRYVAQRPIFVERPVVYYREPVLVAYPGVGAIIGAAIGSIYDNQR